MRDVDDRLDRLESQLEEQQETIEEQQETIDRQRERIAELEAELDDDATQGETLPAVSRRGALTAGGLLALLFGGVGTASANPQGQVGTSSKPLDGLHTDDLYGNSGTITVRDALDLASSDSIQDAGTDAITFDGNQNVTIPNGNLDLNGNRLKSSSGRLILDPYLYFEHDPFIEWEGTRFTLHGLTGEIRFTDNGGIQADGPIYAHDYIDARRVRVTNVDDASGNNHLTFNSDGPLGVSQTLNLNNNDVNNLASIGGGGSAIGLGDDVDLDGNDLTDSSGDLTLNPAGSVDATSSPVVRGTRIVTTNETISKSDYFVDASNGSTDITITLPSSPVTGEEHVIKNNGPKSVTVEGNGHSIDASTSVEIASTDGRLHVIYGGSDWHVITKVT